MARNGYEMKHLASWQEYFKLDLIGLCFLKSRIFHRIWNLNELINFIIIFLYKELFINTPIDLTFDRINRRELLNRDQVDQTSWR